MKKVNYPGAISLLLLTNILFCFAGIPSKELNKETVLKVYNIKDYGAVGDGKTLNTEAINNAIIACSNSGGGTVLVPAGRYVSGTVLLKSNVNLTLENDATIIGATDLKLYKSYTLTGKDPDHPINITVRDSMVWCRALVLLDNVSNVTITGNGTIDGSGLIDKQGEEGRRGPHGIFIGDSRNINISNIRVTRAGNYNIICLYVEDVKFINLTIAEGYDGIHIRNGKNILIENCKFYTRDDAIAGGYWTNMLINDCLINSSCNGIRLILPATNLEIKTCEIFGPGVFGHPRGSVNNPMVTNSLTGIMLQPGAWGAGSGRLDNIYIHDIRIRDEQTALTFVLNKDNQAGKITVENIIATGIYGNACSIEAWPVDSKFENVKFNNVSIIYSVDNEQILKVTDFSRPRTESRPVPYWGFYARNVKNIEFNNVTLNYLGNEIRPVMGFDEVDNVKLNNLKYKDVSGVQPIKYSEKTHLENINTTIIK
jgi:hypothetical protein